MITQIQTLLIFGTIIFICALALISFDLPESFQVSVPLIIALSASCALFLPVSTPPNAIAYSTNLLDQKDFRIGGFYFAGIAPILIFPLAMLVAYLLSLGFSL